jgi:hypothetical protein
MEARGMRYGATIMLGGCAFIAAVLVFEIKSTVRGIERELGRTRQAVEMAGWRLQTLRADYAFLTRPERLEPQAAQLGLVPGTSGRLVHAAGIPVDTSLVFADKSVPVLLPSGQEVQLRFKPAIEPAAMREEHHEVGR